MSSLLAAGSGSAFARCPETRNGTASGTPAYTNVHTHVGGVVELEAVVVDQRRGQQARASTQSAIGSVLNVRQRVANASTSPVASVPGQEPAPMNAAFTLGLIDHA